MLKLGVIGSGWITRQFIDAALETDDYQLVAVYSRSKARGEEFVSDFKDVKVFDQLDEFVAYDAMDIVYIASPNSLHFEQTKAALLAGKNVIVEKPAVTNPEQFEEIHRIAKEKNLYVLEATRSIHEKTFARIKDFLSDKKVIGAKLTYAKYSSKMPALLRGELPNKWNPNFAGGTLMDLGVYILYFAQGLLGDPEELAYDVQLIPSGVDVSGNGILRYKDFDVTLHSAGNLTSTVANEIYTTESTLVVDGVALFHSVEFIKHDGTSYALEADPSDNPLYEEARDFAEFFADPKSEKAQNNYKEWTELGRSVHETLYKMRLSAGIEFPSDNEMNNL